MSLWVILKFQDCILIFLAVVKGRKTGVGHAQLCLTLCDPRTAAHQASLPIGFFRQESWSG